MPKPLFKPPKHLVQEWPEVFEDLYMNTMPVHYLESVRLEFQNGRVWEINVADQLNLSASEIIADRLIETFAEYKDDIKKIDFKINILKLKDDIQSQSNNILN